eukprot:15306584-Ditylum_brightwellii.AAC.1
MVTHTKVKVNWELIKKKHGQNNIKNKIKENQKQIKHEYMVGEKVLIVKLRDQRSKDPKLNKPTDGPYIINQVHRNGMLASDQGKCDKRNHTQRLKPSNE